MELINPSLDNDLGSSWRATQPPPVLGELSYFSAGSQWSYRVGTSSPANWNHRDFVEGAEWLSGQTPIGFGDANQTLNTTLGDMQGNASSVYARRGFSVAAGELPQALLLRHNVDDGFIAFINGVEVARQRVVGAGAFDNTASASQSPEGEWSTLELPSGAVVEGDNVIAVINYNQSKASSDFAFDFELIRPAIAEPEPIPTPGKMSSAFASNAPPAIRQVGHSPKQPKAGEPTLITAKVSDVDGVQSVSLQYQLVMPGAYIPALLAKPHSTLLADPNGPRTPNPAYSDPANWAAVAMLDDGTGGDAVAGDEIYSATLPAQINRALVRYRITVADTPGASVRVPYEDDPSLNFAYLRLRRRPGFCCGHPLGHRAGALHPPERDAHLTAGLHDADDPGRLRPVRRLRRAPRSRPATTDARSAFNWSATFVYNGRVYDNIAYRLRQRNARYAGPANAASASASTTATTSSSTTINGNPYPTKWRTPELTQE